MRRTDRRPRTHRLLAVALLALSVSGLIYVQQVPAVAATSFAGAARADGLVLRVVDPSLPVIPEGRVEVTLSTSQATLDSLGQSRAFASAPYVEAAATLPETVNGLLAGAAPPLPSYPFIVFSDYPTEIETIQQAGPYTISARSDETASTARTTVGAVTNQPKVLTTESFAEVRDDEATDTQFATARSQTAGISIGGIIEIGDVVSTASVRQRGSEPPEIESSFSATALSVLGVPLSLSNDGIRIGTGLVPIPDLGALNGLLGQLGMQLKFLPVEETDTGVSAAGLEITFQAEVPTQGLVTVTAILGRISASIGVADFGGPGADQGAEVVIPDSEVPVLEQPSFDLPSALPEVPAPQARPVRPVTAVAEVGPLASQWAERFYLVVALAAAASLVGGRAAGLLGVQRSQRNLPPKLTEPTPTLRFPRS